MKTETLPIVVGYDGSPSADSALGWGLGEAERTAAPLRVVVVTPADELMSPLVTKFEHDWSRSAAARAHATVSATGSVVSDVSIEHGQALTVLLKEAESARLVVVGSRGHTPVEAEWLGSVSHHLARQAACTVVVVRPAHDPLARTILVGIDGSPASRHALSYAAERATVTHEGILAAHAYHYPSVTRGGLAIDPFDINVDAVEAAERLAAELTAGLAVDYPDVVVRSTAVVGRAARVLSRLSDQASVVVVGSRGRNPIQEILLGSVSQEVLHRAACPVIVLR